MTLHKSVEPCYTDGMTETAMKILARLRRNREKRELLLSDRDDLILEAKAAGVPVTHIAEAVGLDRTQVHRIIRDLPLQRANAKAEARREAMTEEERSAEDADVAALTKRMAQKNVY